MSDVVVYTTDRCSFCVRVKMLLDARGVEFEEINLSGDPAAFVELAKRTGMMTVPQVMVGDTFVGGYQETAEADRTGRLAELLGARAA
jgi:glutaredoxin 3